MFGLGQSHIKLWPNMALQCSSDGMAHLSLKQMIILHLVIVYASGKIFFLESLQNWNSWNCFKIDLINTVVARHGTAIRYWWIGLPEAQTYHLIAFLLFVLCIRWDSCDMRSFWLERPSRTVLIKHFINWCIGTVVVPHGIAMKC